MSKLYLKGCLPSPELAEAKLSPGDEVWTINRQPDVVEKPISRHFSLHGLAEELKVHGESYLEWLSRQSFPIYAWQSWLAQWPDLTKCPMPSDLLTFPLGSIRVALKPAHDYFTGSFAYLLAFVELIQDSPSPGHRLNKSFRTHFDEVHIVGVEFSNEQLWKSRLRAAIWIEDDEHIGYGSGLAEGMRQVVDDLRGQYSGDESWARECIMYWCGRLEAKGIRIVTYPSSHLFYNRWLETHAQDCEHGDLRGLYGLDPCIGG